MNGKDSDGRELGITTLHMREGIERRLFGTDEPTTVGRYRLIERVGRGGMGTVFRAHDPSLSREVAVKVLSGTGTGSQRSALVARLLREARLLARLNHPNVVAVHDVGEYGDDVFIAMEYVVGRTLRAWLDERADDGKRRLAAGIDLLIEAGRGLAAAHEIGLVHRDFKPDNVLVGDDGRVRVVDFGLAHAHLEADVEITRNTAPGDSVTLTGSGQIVGTPAYMAPEQFASGDARATADQYAFCVVLFELAFGRRPFSGKTLEELAERVRDEPVRLPERPKVPSALRRILLRGLARAPEERYPDLATLLAALGRVRGGRRRVAGVALLGLGALAGGLAVRSMSPSVEPACTDVASAMEDAWSVDAAAEIEAAFAATGRAYAGAVSKRAVAAVDAFAQRWTAARIDACEDTLVRDEQSTDVMDRRVACLQRALRQTAATVEIWRDADAAVVDGAATVASRLPTIEPCEQVDVLLTIEPLPADEATRAEIDRIAAGTARARALIDVSRFAKAKAELDGLEASAEAIGHAPTVADVLDATARVQVGLGELAEATATARRAFSMALRGGDDRTAMRLAVHIAFRSGAYDRDTQRTLEWTDLARSLATRIGGDPYTDAAVARIEAIAHVIDYRMAEAVPLFEHAIEIYRELGEDAAVSTAIADLAGTWVEAGDLERAEPLYQQAIAMKREIYGGDHPSLVNDFVGLAFVLERKGALEHAESVLREAVAISEATYGPDHVDLGYVLTTLGGVQIGSKRPAEAVATLERAVAIRRAQLGEDAPFTTETRRTLAQAYVKAGRVQEGTALFEEVVAATRRQLAPDDPELAITLAIASEGLASAGETARAAELAREARSAIADNARATDDHRKRVTNSTAAILDAKSR